MATATKTPLGTLIRAGLRVAHPSLMRVLIEDLLGRPSRTENSRRHLDAAIAWMCHAQDVCGGRGVSAGFAFMHGWFPPYPETTGYIIPTFYDYGHLTGNEMYFDRARRMADWEIEVQLPSGAVMGSVYRGPGHEAHPVVFNTGQVILGWCRAYSETGDARYLSAAKRAGDWLVSVQSKDGAWRLTGPVTETQVHAYDVRTAWSLLEIDALAKNEIYAAAAKRNLDWTLAQQHENGWYENNAFFANSKWTVPLTHTIAYVMEGFIESWRLTGVRSYFDAAHKTGEKLMRIFELRRYLAGEFDKSWKTSAKYSCLTGDAQVAGVWLQLFRATKDTRFLSSALKLSDFVKASQNLRSLHPGLRGGVKGSQPISGKYTPYTYVNWGAKFLADTLMLEEKLMNEFEQAVRRGERLGPGDIADEAIAQSTTVAEA
jgi:uncharacterized protein YyaL (SSP411 family)